MGNWKIVVDSVEKDLDTDYSFAVETMTGVGMPPVINNTQPLTLQPGESFVNQKYGPRKFGLKGTFIGSSLTNFHALRQALIKALNPSTGSINAQPTPIEFRYEGATDNKYIKAVYDSGLEMQGPNGFNEEVTLQLFCPDPFFYATTESTAALDTNDSATFTLVAKRNGDASVDIWDNLGPPDAAGTYVACFAFAADDTYIYIGGNFVNFDNIANADRIVRLNKSTGAYSALSTGMDSTVLDLAIGPDGNLYAAGSFTTAGGNTVNNIAVWNGSTWSDLDTGANNAVNAIAFGSDGTLYAGGDFTQVGSGPTAAVRVASWDGSSWSAMGSGVSGSVDSIAIQHGNSNIYFGGNFTTAGGTAVNYISYWDGSAWNALDTGMDSRVNSVAVKSNGDVFASGQFTTAGGTAATYIAKWNGVVWSSLGATLDDAVGVIGFGADEVLYLGGDFTQIGDLTIASNVAKWNGSTFAHLDFNVPGPPVRTLYLDGDDLYLGFNTSGSSNYSGDTTIAYGGTARAYPYITIARSGGTTATLKQIRQESTKAELLFNYTLLDGETLTIELRPDQGIAVTSSFFGSVPNAVLPNSNLGQFYLTPGNGTGDNNNVITAFVDTTGSPTITAVIYYNEAFLSID